MEIVGGPRGDDSSVPRLEQLYVEQAVSEQAISESTDPGSELPPAWEVVRDNRRLVLLGDPGGGKSTLVRWIAYQFATAGPGRSRPDGWPARLGYDEEKPALPLPFVLRELKIREGVTWEQLWQAFLDRPLQSPLDDDLLKPLLRDGHAIFLIDGLDEVGSPAARLAAGRDPRGHAPLPQLPVAADLAHRRLRRGALPRGRRRPERMGAEF